VVALPEVALASWGMAWLTSHRYEVVVAPAVCWVRFPSPSRCHVVVVVPTLEEVVRLRRSYVQVVVPSVRTLPSAS
jgi:hypothetical protein